MTLKDYSSRNKMENELKLEKELQKNESNDYWYRIKLYSVLWL